MKNTFCALVGQHLLIGLLIKFPKCNFELDIPGILNQQSYTLSLTEYVGLLEVQVHALKNTLQYATLVVQCGGLCYFISEERRHNRKEVNYIGLPH